MAPRLFENVVKMTNLEVVKIEFRHLISYRPREALNIIRISSALYNAILYGIVLAQYRTQGFSTLMRVVGIFRHKQRLCALLCSFMQCSISKIRQ